MNATIAPTELPTPSRHRRRITLRRICALLGLAVVVATTTGALWQHLASTRTSATITAPGELVNVDGRNLHLLVAGEGDGPTIVLEAGLLGFSAQWAWVQQQLASNHTVVAYDRPGQGWSETDPEGVDPHRIATDLHTALQQTDLPGPWVLVGHSLGGHLVRTFAELYPDDVAGIVLIDSSHPEQPDAPGPIAGHVMRLAGRSGLLRATGALDRQAAGLPTATLIDALPRLNATAHLDGTSREMQAFERFAQAAAHAGDLGTTPLTVISAGTQPEHWHQLQRDLATLSTSSRHVTVDEAGHQSLVTEQDHASVVASEIARTAALSHTTNQQ